MSFKRPRQRGVWRCPALCVPTSEDFSSGCSQNDQNTGGSQVGLGRPWSRVNGNQRRRKQPAGAEAMGGVEQEVCSREFSDNRRHAFPPPPDPI